MSTKSFLSSLLTLTFPQKIFFLKKSPVKMADTPSVSRGYWSTFSPASISFSLLKDPSASVVHILENNPTYILLPQVVLVKSVELVVLEMLSKCLLDGFPNSVADIRCIRVIFSKENCVCVCACIKVGERRRERLGETVT